MAFFIAASVAPAEIVTSTGVVSSSPTFIVSVPPLLVKTLAADVKPVALSLISDVLVGIPMAFSVLNPRVSAAVELGSLQSKSRSATVALVIVNFLVVESNETV